MSISYRRYEILIPSRYNGGRPVPDSLFAETLDQLRQRFGAVSSETQVIRGQWEDGGGVFRDENVRVFIDVPDTTANREFFQNFKELLKKRFEQIELWITSYPVDVL